ncbi:MAG: hypothetical protein ACFFCS_29885 [Candidatus Hodarchaeota archaeon]
MVNLVFDLFGNLTFDEKLDLSENQVLFLKESYEKGRIGTYKSTMKILNELDDLVHVHGFLRSGFLTALGLLYYEYFHIPATEYRFIDHLMNFFEKIYDEYLKNENIFSIPYKDEEKEYKLSEILIKLGFIKGILNKDQVEIHRISNVGKEYIKQHKESLTFGRLFSIITDGNAIEIIKERFNIIQDAAKRGYYATAIIYMGSILEYIIEYKFERGYKTWLSREPGKKENFETMLEFLNKTNKIDSIEWADSTILRKLRNSIHIGRYLKDYEHVGVKNYDRASDLFRVLCERFLS